MFIVVICNWLCNKQTQLSSCSFCYLVCCCVCWFCFPEAPPGSRVDVVKAVKAAPFLTPSLSLITSCFCPLMMSQWKTANGIGVPSTAVGWMEIHTRNAVMFLQSKVWPFITDAEASQTTLNTPRLWAPLVQGENYHARLPWQCEPPRLGALVLFSKSEPFEICSSFNLSYVSR